jgi:NADH-quinone oxidoreductase E subunit
MKKKERERLLGVIEGYKEREGALISVLQRAQDIIGWLPEDALTMIAEGLGLPVSKVYGVATFYSAFYLEPHGKYTIRCCRGTACHVKGARQVLSAVCRMTGLKDGETSKDLKFSLETVTCLGACALSPVMMVNKDYFGKMTEKKVETVLGQYK